MPRAWASSPVPIAGLLKTRSCVSVGPPLSDSVVLRIVSMSIVPLPFTPTMLPSTPSTSPPLPPTVEPIRLCDDPATRLAVSRSLGVVFVPAPLTLPATIVLCNVSWSAAVKMPPWAPVPLPSESARLPVKVELRITVGPPTLNPPVRSLAELPLNVELIIVAPTSRNTPPPSSSVRLLLMVLASIVTTAPLCAKIAPPSLIALLPFSGVSPPSVLPF